MTNESAALEQYKKDKALGIGFSITSVLVAIVIVFAIVAVGGPASAMNNIGGMAASVMSTLPSIDSLTGNSSKKDSAVSEYILPESSSITYTADQLSGFSDWELCCARNEIYARHGYEFTTSELADYFQSKSWYKPGEFSESSLNATEKANVETILGLEIARGSEYRPGA